MSEIAGALKLAVWLAFFAWLISTGARWPLYVITVIALLIWWAND